MCEAGRCVWNTYTKQNIWRYSDGKFEAYNKKGDYWNRGVWFFPEIHRQPDSWILVVDPTTEETYVLGA
jgi:hypothetical protein